LLYADNIVVMADIEDDLIKRLNEQKDNVENRGMRKYGPVDATATHCLLFQQNPDWFYLSGTSPPK